MAAELLAGLRRQMRRLLASTPATELISRTARSQWRLILAGSLTAVVAALSEGFTLAIIFLVVDVLTGVGSASALPWPWLASWLEPLPASGLAALLMAGAVLAQGLQSLMRYGNKVCVGYFAARCRARITALIHRQVLSFSFPCASHYKVGELTAFASTAPVAVQQQIETLSDLVISLLMALVYLLVLVRISPWLLLAAVALAAAITSLQKTLEPRVRAGALRQVAVDQAISARAVEDYQALRLLHSSGQLELADQRLQGLMGEMEAAFRGQARRLSLLEPVASFLPILAVAVIVSLSLVLLGVQAGQVLPGLVTFVLALQRLNVRLGGIANSWNALAENSGRLALTDEILTRSDKQFRRIGGVPFEGLTRQIRFEAVGLSYGQDQPAALTELSFNVSRGETLALVGPSGAGKSSIADLLVGLYEPSEGQIWVDDQPLSALDLPSWQQRLGVVSQDTFLFNASIAENLSFGLEGVSQQQLECAAAQAQAAGFIEALPEDYNTLVGERGYRLSGGQRQRLSLARALLRQPELLILDEATSALDSASERLVQEAIQQVEGHCTVLVIAHRLSTIVNADQILVLERGRIIQRGNHQQLLEIAGMYQQLWQQQSQAAVI
jgi:subfamily B ATP-binding cassette protein MsbA